MTDRLDAHFMRGRIYFELQQWDNAEAAYLAVINIERDYPGVRHNLGNIYYGKRQNRQALDSISSCRQRQRCCDVVACSGGGI